MTTTPATQAHDRIAESICQTIAEIPDRSSPDDDPDMMLVTSDELHTIVVCALENEAERQAHSLPGDVGGDLDRLLTLIETAHEHGDEIAIVEQAAKVRAALTPSALSGDAGEGLAAIASERTRQIEVEGWSPEHDDEHADCQMAGAAACYAMSAIPHWAKHEAIRLLWPWSKDWWKPRSHRENLVRAGALIVAEIDRIDRAAALPSHKGAGE